jgi:hypothetical protein
MLFEAWVFKLSQERLGFAQRSSGSNSEGPTATFGDILNDHFVLHGSGLDIERVTLAGVREGVVQVIIEDSIARVAAGDMGDPVVYQLEMTLKPFDFISGAVHLMRTLGDQIHIEGSRRLSDTVLLDFEQGLLADAPGEGLLLAPSSKFR